MITIATVLKCGGEYTAYHVDVMKRAIDKHGTSECKFVCLTDFYSGNFEKIRLENNWPKWWSKMELFKIKGPVLYFDLDTIIVGSLIPLIEIAKSNQFSILRDVYQGTAKPNAMQSSIMAWNDDMSYLYNRFKNDDKQIIKLLHGDQAFITRNVHPKTVTFFQDIIPDTLLSFKADVQGKSIFTKTSAVFFHGFPRPWQQTQIAYDNTKK